MLKVLIVEDEEFIRKGLVYTIDWTSMSCVVVADAENGKEGLEKIIEFKPDLVITDIRMPIMNGIDMITEAQKTERFESVFLTSYTEFEYAKKAIELKVADYLVKPVDVDRLKEIIYQVQKEKSDYKKQELRVNQGNQEHIKINIQDLLDQQDAEQSSYVKRAIAFIQKNYHNKITISVLADELGVSISYLSRKLKEETTHSFLEILNAYRVMQAVKLLGEGKLRIAEISEMTGFTDYKNFSNVFKRYTGLSPTEFVKKVQ